MAGTGMPYGQIENGAIAAKCDRIVWVGSMDALTGKPDTLANDVVDIAGKWITPGLIDCHTHLVFGGSRASEFEQRLQGVSYEEIARTGGGIVSTMTATREASEEALVRASLPRLSNLIREGCTTVEIKSGYGLEKSAEIKQLSTARTLGKSLPVNVQTTFLGAHALPPEFNGRQADYIEQVIEEMMPAVAESGTADAVDAFCESIGFTAAETEAVFKSAQAMICQSSCMQSNCLTLAAQRWRHGSARCRRTTWNLYPRMVFSPWLPPVPWPSFCRAHFTFFGKPSCRL